MRRCQRIGCENSLDHHRADARYCGPTCKREAARSANLSDGSAAPGFWDRYAQIRRSRQRRIAAITLLTPLAALAACGGRHAPYKTLPRPPLPPALATPPICSKLPAKQHVMGACLPRPEEGERLANPRAAVSPIQGPDLSNNDPVFSSSSWAAIASRSHFAYLKSVEGTGYYDRTAAAMAAQAKAHRLPVGGYDFMHVCGNSASAEADYFVRSLHGQGLLGAGTLPPAADVEYGSGSCGGRSWVQAWVNEVYAQDGHICPIAYTGAWWWQPNIGSYWPTCAGHELLSWISGYGVSRPYMPSGLSHLDFWQFSDNGFNGATNADLSAWMHDAASFAAFASTGPPPDPYAVFQDVTYDLGHGIKANEKTIVKGWNDRHCLNPTRRPVCGFLRYRLVLLRGRIVAVASRSHPADYSTGHRYKRVKYIEHQLAQTKGPWQP